MSGNRSTFPETTAEFGGGRQAEKDLMCSYRFIAVLLLAIVSVCALPAIAADSVDRQTLVVDEKDFPRYWELAPERTSGTLPPAARGIPEVLKKHGEVVLEFVYTIDHDGVPKELELISITPKDVDSRRFIAYQLSQRFRPGPDNKKGIPVRVRLVMPYFIPEHKPTSLPSG